MVIYEELYNGMPGIWKIHFNILILAQTAQRTSFHFLHSHAIRNTNNLVFESNLLLMIMVSCVSLGQDFVFSPINVVERKEARTRSVFTTHKHTDTYTLLQMHIVNVS